MEGRLRRHRNVVVHWRIVGLATSDPDVCTARLDDPVGLLSSNDRVQQHRATCQRVRQSLALIPVEDGKALEERNCPRLAILALRLVGLVPRCEAIGIADDRALLAVMMPLLPIEAPPCCAYHLALVFSASAFRPPQNKPLHVGQGQKQEAITNGIVRE